MHPLEPVLKRAERHSFTKEYAISKIDHVVCWTTWDEIQRIVEESAKYLEIENASIKNSIRRVAQSISNSIEWHK